MLLDTVLLQRVFWRPGIRNLCGGSLAPMLASARAPLVRFSILLSKIRIIVLRMSITSERHSRTLQTNGTNHTFKEAIKDSIWHTHNQSVHLLVAIRLIFHHKPALVRSPGFLCFYQSAELQEVTVSYNMFHILLLFIDFGRFA